MDKYKTLKRLVLFNALFSVLYFFLPIVWLNGIENIGLGFSFVIGITVSKPSSPLYQDSYLAYVQSARLYEWLMRISFILAIASLVLAVLLFIKKYNNGSNKKKVDITILVSVALSLVSALLIFSILPISISIRGVVSPEGFYGYEPIITFVITAVIAVLFVKSKREIATAEGSPQGEKSETGEGQKKDKPKSGFFKQWKRSKGAIYGDIEGPVTKLKRGRMSIAYEDGKFIAFLLGAGEFELSEKNVERLELIEENVSCENIANMFGVKKEIDRYKIVMKDGQVGTLRLVHEIADAVVGLLCGDSDEAEETSDMDELDDETKAALTFFQKAAESPDSPIGKSLDWFQSKKGLEVYKVYTAPRNFILQSRYVQEFKKMFAGEKTNVDFDRHFLPVTYPDAKLPRTYYKALLESLGAEAVKNDVVRAFLLDTLLSISIPYTLDEDGEPVPRDTALIPEQFVSAEKNPLLYFVKNFNVFKFEHDDLGHLAEKFIIYRAAISCILPFVVSNNKVDIQWLLDKDTYINEFGVLRKLKGFIKKCKELTDNAEYHQYLDELLKKFLAEMESDKKE